MELCTGLRTENIVIRGKMLRFFKILRHQLRPLRLQRVALYLASQCANSRSTPLMERKCQDFTLKHIKKLMEHGCDRVSLSYFTKHLASESTR